MPFNLLFVATQFGSFNVIYPILKACSNRHSIGYIGIKDFEGTMIYKRVTAGDVEIDHGGLNRFDLFITGTSPYSEVEYKIWQYAARLNKKSICILDSHKDYERRFLKNNRYFFPDIICVMNEGTKGFLSSMNIDPYRMVVTGSPYLDSIYKYKLMDKERDMMKNGMLQGRKKIITFCTEYIAATGEKGKYGYDELQILDDILYCIKSLRMDNFKLFIRLHPKDSIVFYEDFLKRFDTEIDYEFVRNDPEHKLLQLSDIVIGITSVILLEASILGLNVVSYQPTKDRTKIHRYIDGIDNDLVTSRTGLMMAICKLLNSSSMKIPYNSKYTPSNALGKIMEIIEKVLHDESFK